MTNKLDTKIYQLAEATTQVSLSHPAQVASPAPIAHVTSRLMGKAVR